MRYRRSTNGGSAWSTSITLSSTAATSTYGAAVAASGNAIDAAWIEERGGNWVLVYRRSTNAGSTWRTPIILSGTVGTASVAAAPAAVVVPVGPSLDLAEVEANVGRPRAAAGDADANRPIKPRTATRDVAAGGTSPSYPRLSRNSSGVVIVTWTDDLTGWVYVRRSTDGGATFLTALHVDTTTNDPTEGYLDAFPVIAAGTGIHYVAYYKTPSSLRVIRSTNGGATWTAPTTLASNGSGFVPDIVASGASALVGYSVWASPNQYTAIRRTSTSGASWNAAVAIGPTTGSADIPAACRHRRRVLARRLRALPGYVVMRRHRRSTTGTAPTRRPGRRRSACRTRTRPTRVPGGLAYGSRLGLAFEDWAPALLDSNAFFRAGS